MEKHNYFQNVFDQQLEVLVIGDLKKNTPTVPEIPLHNILFPYHRLEKLLLL